MDLTPARRHLLPLLRSTAAHGGSRDVMTCTYRCGNACDHPEPNTSGNPHIADIIQTVVTRRSLLKAGAASGLVLGTSGLLASPAAAEPIAPEVAAELTRRGGGGRPAVDLTFDAVPPNRLDTVVVPNGYDSAVVIRWGDPVESGAPAFDLDAQTADAQAKQFGYNCDYVAVLPLSRDRALLVVNHEYTDEVLMFRGYTDGASAPEEQLRIAMMAHGMSVVEIQRVGRTGQWWPRRRSRYNRRITPSTAMQLTGPAAGHPLLQTNADPTGIAVYGTLNDCAGGTTPWGTTLHGEENFNQYFVGAAGVPEADKPALARYGFATTATEPAADNRRWDRIDPRFDLSQEPNEANRFGYIVELDPFDPTSTPRKRTALGRLKHEGATIALAADRRAVAYMGDDERGDYLYKYVSTDRYRRGRRRRDHEHNLTLLDNGTLYVARLTGDSPISEIDGTGTLPSDGEFDGTGEWIPLVSGTTSYVPGFSAEEVLVRTRLAADTVGATRMDRPEDVERNPVTGRVYAALTNNSNRTAATVDEANPLAQSIVAGGAVATGNRNGYVLEWEEAGGDAAAATLSWRLFLVAGDPSAPETYFAGYPKEQVSPISCPDNVAFDPSGNLWIATDGNALGSNDGLFAVPVEGPERGYVKQFLTVPIGAETCGPLITEDGRTVFVAVQHPGEISGATVDNPASTWPDGRFPRPSVVCAWNTGRADLLIGR